MSKLILKALSIFAGKLDLAPDVNTLSIGASGQEVDTTNFAGNGWRETLPGLRDSEWTFDGFMQAGVTDEELLAMLSKFVPITVAMTRPVAAGDLAYGMNGAATMLSDKKPVGQAHGMALRFKGASPTARGKILANETLTATGNTAAMDYGAAVPALSRLYLLVHVTDVSGTTPTLDLVLESDDAGTFLSPVTRITVPQFTEAGYYFGYVDGAITDTFYRLAATAGGTTPSFALVAMIGTAALT